MSKNGKYCKKSCGNIEKSEYNKKRKGGDKMEREYYSLKELAERWGLSKRGLNNYVTSGKIKAIKIGNKYLVHKSEIERIERGG